MHAQRDLFLESFLTFGCRHLPSRHFQIFEECLLTPGFERLSGRIAACINICNGQALHNVRQDGLHPLAAEPSRLIIWRRYGLYYAAAVDPI